MKSPEKHLQKLENFLDNLPDDCGQLRHVRFVRRWIEHAGRQIECAKNECDQNQPMLAAAFLRSINQ